MQAVGTVNVQGPAPQHPPPALIQSSGFQLLAASQPPTVQSSDQGRMGSGNVAPQEQGQSNQVEVDQIQPSPPQPPNHSNVVSDPPQLPRGVQRDRQTRQVFC